MVNAKLQMNMKVDREEIYWEQRARANWLKNRDRNTAFFHKFASQRKRLNRISCLEDSDGRIVEGDVGVGRIAHDYFVNLFSTQGVIDEEDILLGVDKCITDSMNANLDRPFTKEKIFSVLLLMSPIKDSGDDGLEVRFWPILGDEVACYCIGLLKGEVPINLINHTHIVLIPKVKNPRDEFSSHKPLQRTKRIFVGRLISDNIVAAYEILISMKNRRLGKEGSFALKLDMSKTYDRVEWWFIKGDHLSPYLFLLCGEGLSTLLRLRESSDAIRGTREVRGAPRVTHLLFADGSLIFGDATAMGTSNVLKVLQLYAKCSGQLVNFEKSSVFFSSNVDMRNRLDVGRILGIRHADNLEKYLSLPCMVGQNKKWAFASLRDKIQSQISSWSTRLLSIGGREVFIKSILPSNPNIRNDTADKRGIHFCGWSFFSKLKDDRGMGFKDLTKFNVTILAKQGWRILLHPTSLMARILRSKYFPNTRFLSTQLGFNPSLV
ncbi:reverse transcriptase [Gossypium australe]|uniref:Reverse transcriptase n=1 Tax=Gossypium australe TaxID=47621 RepID=A0A5B6X5N3_9ROSI|nr:reverse transcriptase [Gossypium australe]